ncbi:MAG: tRNA (guanosine(37)-N1)-methyltransferase TrmD [Proteobacteria bacterium]|nr:tRNA (guanosine(37)-N1)-methyltransferase TrmD [Pseudomonadota bacterium]
MTFTVLTIFPELIDSFLDTGMIRKALEKELISCSSVNIRDFAEGKHKVTDDRPYGGGCGMVMKPEPLAKAIRSAKEASSSSKTILLTPQGTPFNQKRAHHLSTYDGLILVCGRYEGVDERICHELVDEEISIGDFVLTGGELAAMVIIDAVVRLIPGVLGGALSASQDSFEDQLLEYPHYTRPYSFEGQDVPEVLISGDHARIDRWRLEASLKRTFLRRPELLSEKKMTRPEIDILKKWCIEIGKIIQAQS